MVRTRFVAWADRADLGGLVRSVACGDVVPGCRARHAAGEPGVHEVSTSLTQGVRDRSVTPA
jgi:hypothetical protein